MSKKYKTATVHLGDARTGIHPPDTRVSPALPSSSHHSGPVASAQCFCAAEKSTTTRHFAEHTLAAAVTALSERVSFQMLPVIFCSWLAGTTLTAITGPGPQLGPQPGHMNSRTARGPGKDFQSAVGKSWDADKAAGDHVQVSGGLAGAQAP